jgi:hypothetical protein
MMVLHYDEDTLSEEGNLHERQWRNIGAVFATTVKEIYGLLRHIGSVSYKKEG